MVIWVVIIGNFLSNLIPYTADQAVVQRYLTTKNEKEARKSLWIAALMVIPGSLIFFGIGTALFAFYKTNPALLDPTLSNDSIFPHFINQSLPAGIAGLVIAGVFAAAMSSLDSSMNSIATAFTTDFYRRFKPDAEDKKCLDLARIVTVVLGVLGTVSAVVLASYGGRIKSLWFLFAKLIGLVGGGLAGVFILAIFTRRASGRGALVGAITGAVVQIYVAFFTDVHFFLYAAVGIVTSCAVGYAASLVLPDEPKSIDGMTIHSLGKTPG
ncbi:MAG: sodium:solute symporter family transporter [Planctomycetota bacterium]|jgi:Na+/proline symporter